MPKGPFHIRTVLNPGGTLAYEVSGMLQGVQQRKRFKTREAAVAYQRELELRMAKSPLQEPRLTWLTHIQLSEAEAAQTMLAQKYPSGAHGAIAAAQYYIAHYWEPISDHTLATAKEIYFPEKRKKVSRPQMKSIEQVLNRIAKDFPDTKLHDLSRTIIEKWLKTTLGACAPKTWNNNRGILVTFFNWCLDEPRKWIPSNPVNKIPIEDIATGVAQIYSVNTARELMAEIESIDEGSFALVFALLQFAGIRPDREDGELFRIAQQIELGLRTEDFTINDKQIFLSENMTKTGDPRWIDLPSNLKEWLKAYPPTPANFNLEAFSKHHARLRKKYNIPHDGPRHCFCSYDAKLHGPGHAAMAAGHTEEMQRKRYRNGSMSKEEAEQFFMIVPTRSPLRNAP